MNHQIKIEQRDPAELRGHIHPTLKTIPELDEKSEEFLAIAAGMGQLGIRQPLQIDDAGRVLDDHSRTLLRCALRWQLKTVPVIVVPDPNVPLTIISGLAHRRHLTKSAIAYLAAGLIDQALTDAKHKHLKSLANTQDFPKGVSSETTNSYKTADEMASDLGIGRNLLFEARKVLELFADKKCYAFNLVGGSKDGSVMECTLKAWFEPRILKAPIGGEHEQNRPLGLGGVIAGIASVRQGDKGKFDPRSKQPELFSKQVIDACLNHVKQYQADKPAVLAALRKRAEELEPAQCDHLAEMYSTMAKIYASAAKANA